jgi:hypothetical protein
MLDSTNCQTGADSAIISVMVEVIGKNPGDGQNINVTSEVDDLAAARALRTLATSAQDKIADQTGMIVVQQPDGSTVLVPHNPHAADALSASIALASQFRRARAEKRKGK